RAVPMPQQRLQPQTDCFLCKPGDRDTLLRALTGTDDGDRTAAEHAREHLPRCAMDDLVGELVRDLKDTRNPVYRGGESGSDDEENVMRNPARERPEADSAEFRGIRPREGFSSGLRFHGRTGWLVALADPDGDRHATWTRHARRWRA